MTSVTSKVFITDLYDWIAHRILNCHQAEKPSQVFEQPSCYSPPSKNLKSPDLKRINHTGLVFKIGVSKLIFTSGVICNVYGLGQDKQYIEIVTVGVSAHLPRQVTDPTQNNSLCTQLCRKY